MLKERYMLRISVFVILIICVIAIIGMALPLFQPIRAQTIIFESGFENPLDSEWTSWGCYPDTAGAVQIVETQKHHGKSSLEAEVYQKSAQAVVRASVVSEDPAAQKNVFVRWYVRFHNLSKIPNRGSVELLYLSRRIVFVKLARDGSGNLYWMIYRIYPTAGSLIGGPANLSDNEWCCLEFGFKKDSALGGYELYENGICKLNETEDTSSAPDPQRIDIGIHWANSPLTFKLWVDCVIVADSYIGPEAEPEPNQYSLTVNSTPLSGLPVVVSHSTFMTKFKSGTSILLPEGQYNVSLPGNISLIYDDEQFNEILEFAHWEDGSIGSTRPINIVADTSLTATYQTKEKLGFYKISIDHLNHENYGLTYPVTYIFSIPNNQSLMAYKKYSLLDNWVQVPERLKGELFSGVEAARFDHEENKAYISLAFGSYSDHIYVRITDLNGNDVESSFVGIAEYYDNRKMVVCCTIDDIGADPPWGGNDKFLQASEVFSEAQVWWTGAIITTGSDVDWEVYQTGIDRGYLEVASHSRTHPDSPPYASYDSEIGGSRDDIIGNLSLPYMKDTEKYVWCWIEPSGKSDDLIQEKLGEYRYLVSRKTGETNSSTPWAEWDEINNHYSRAISSVYWDNSSLELLNEVFNEVYEVGGIYHIWGHIGRIGWSPGEIGYEHVNYVKGKSDVWYVGFGHLYAYARAREIVYSESLSEYVLLKSNFHTHTTYSDGEYTPAEVVELFHENGFNVLAITDHNTLLGFEEAKVAGETFGMTIICGEEISCLWSDGSIKDIVALFIQEPISASYELTDVVEPYFQQIHAQGGISYVAHPWYDSWGKWMEVAGNISNDGWEIHPYHADEMQWVIKNSGKLYVYSYDFHGNADIDGLQGYYSVVISRSESPEDVKEALLQGLVVIVGNQGKTIYGNKEAISLYILLKAVNTSS